MRLPISFLFLILFASVVSCKKTTKQVSPQSEGTYFSIKAYAADQWKVYHGEPFGIIKVADLNGKKDSVITNIDNIKLGDIMKIFFDADISGKKLDGLYDFSSFRDSLSATDNFVYEAKDKKLFTQRLNITANIATHRISSVYMETARNTQFGTHTQKLLYIPIKSISIQDYESSLLGESRDLKVEYIFL